MRLKGVRRSRNVEDRRGRGSGGGKVAISGGGLILILILALVFKMDPMALLDQTGAIQGGSPGPAEMTAAQEETVDFVKGVLGSTEEVWHEEFRKIGAVYQEPKLVLFTGGVRSGCGFASSQVGPFYCPADRTIYLDLGFFEEMRRRFNAPGDFAQAYVIAHEVGHHVQNLLGISGQVRQAQQGRSKADANALSVRLELQADFLAGLWANRGQARYAFLEEGDIEEALRAANAIGDDTLQKQAQGHVVPDSFTHGTSEQRMRWFMKGFRGEAFDPENTFRGEP